MKVEKNKVVTLSYTLYKNNEKGEVIEVCPAEQPMEFIFAFGNLLPKFEENIENMEVGEEFNFVLAPADAYGERTEEAVVPVAMDIFKVNGEIQKQILFVGSEIPMRDNQGHPLTGVVRSVDEAKNEVVMDFNHPLAGIDLFFSGKIESIREATDEELANGLHQHSCSGCHGGCDSGSCGDHEHDHNHEGGCCGGCH